MSVFSEMDTDAVRGALNQVRTLLQDARVQQRAAENRVADLMLQERFIGDELRRRRSIKVHDR